MTLNSVDTPVMQGALKRNRTRMRQLLRDYKEWAQRQSQENDAEEKRYLSYEGMFLRNHFKDGWALYRTVSHEYHQSQRVADNDIQDNKKAA